jgi:RNA polymerase sigma-70 factor (ECF subfamily)
MGSRTPNGSDEPMRPVLAAVNRESRARLLASLAFRFRDLDLAEDSLQEALARAMRVWSEEGIPRSPEAWLTTVAARAAIDTLRKEQRLASRIPLLGAELEREAAAGESLDPATTPEQDPSDALTDDQLGLLFACAHPALNIEDRVALTLRFVAGLTTTEVAQALLLPVTTLQQRITRAKLRIRKLGISFEVPTGSLMEERLPAVRKVITLLYAEGFARSTGVQHVHDDLTSEAVRLAGLLQAIGPRSAENIGLLALLQLSEARRPARTDSAGRPIPLAEQNRALWDRELIASGLKLAEEAASLPGARSYAVQGAIAAVHAEAPSFEQTDWRQIVVLYRLLEAHEPGPIVKLGGAIAAGRASGPDIGLRLLEELGTDPRLVAHRSYHIARAVTLEELGDREAAAEAYRRALGIPGNDAENQMLLSALAEQPT